MSKEGANLNQPERGHRAEDREDYNKARAEQQKEEFIEGEGPTARAMERESKERSEKRKEAEAALQRRLQMVEGFIENHKMQIESSAKEIASLNQRWSEDPERRAMHTLAIKTKESMKNVSEKELDELLKERDNIVLEIQKLEY